MKLTERKIETLTVDRGRKDRLVFDDAQRGLAVRVTASGGRTYICQYSLHGQKWRVPLGACSALSLSNARGAAAAIMGEVAKGRNPAAERKEAAAAERAKRIRGRLTLAVLIEDWARLHLVHRRPRYATEAVRALRHALAKHLDSPAEDLDRATVVRVLDSLSRRHKDKGRARGTAIAGRTAAYGRACFAWGMKRGTVPNNPFAELPLTTITTTRDRVLSDKEAGAVWRAAGDTTLPYGAIVRILMLTGQRREEVAGMTWAELSEDLKTWTIPGMRTKNGMAHIVPLSLPACQLLRSLLPKPAEDARHTYDSLRKNMALVFPGERGTPFSGWSKAKLHLDAVSGIFGW